MEYRRFGQTSLDLSVFTIGGMRFLYGWDEPHDLLPDASLQNAEQVIHAGLEAGFNLIETARGYGKSERLIGHVLRRLPERLRGRFHLMTKATPTDDPEEMRRNLEESLGFLGLDRVELFAIHGINAEADYAKTFGPRGCLKVMERARDDGLIGHLGFSSHAPLPLLLRTIHNGAFEFVNLHYYHFRTNNWPAIALASALDMGVFIISPNDKGGQLYAPPAKLSGLTAPLHPVNYNERWILAHPEIHTMSLGVSEPEHVAIHLKSLEPTPYWGAPERTAQARLREAVADPLMAQCRAPCTRCLPCPEQIDIPELMRLTHLADSFGMTGFGRYRYGEMAPDDNWIRGAKADACTRCDDCLARCPAGFAIPDLLISKIHPRLVAESGLP